MTDKESMNGSGFYKNISFFERWRNW